MAEENASVSAGKGIIIIIITCGHNNDRRYLTWTEPAVTGTRVPAKPCRGYTSNSLGSRTIGTRVYAALDDFWPPSEETPTSRNTAFYKQALAPFWEGFSKPESSNLIVSGQSERKTT